MPHVVEKQYKGESMQGIIQKRGTMQVLHVREYNRIEMQKYSKRCDEWQAEGGYNSRQIFPQQAFYGFYTNQGQFRQTGYVAFADKTAGDKRSVALWRSTKKQVIADFNKQYN